MARAHRRSGSNWVSRAPTFCSRSGRKCIGEVWELVLLPILENDPAVQAVTLLRHLQMTSRAIDVHALPTMLAALRLPSFHSHWPSMAERADKEGWPTARFSL